mgnify:CR=1 FL=1
MQTLPQKPPPQRQLTDHDATEPVLWSAKWLSLPGQDRSDSAPAPYLRKEFTCAQPLRKARLIATALGWYELRINGKKVEEDAVFFPGWTDYRKRVPYHTFDVTSFIRPGTNALGALLGDGWYCGYLGFHNKSHIYGTLPELLLQLELTYQDGFTATVSTDESWQATEGPIVMADIYNGETYDARLEMPGWDLPGFDSGEWTTVQSRQADSGVLLEPARHAPVRKMETLPVQDCWMVEPGRWIFDLGQNMVGWARVILPSESGRSYTIRFAEMLEQDRTLYTENYRSARSVDHYTARGGAGFETWEPTFTFHGFRYVELSGLDPAITPDLNWITGVVLHSDMQQIGDFSCSHPDLNQLQSNLVWGQKGNFLEVPTDCPQRDERLGWTGDAQVFAATATFNFDTLAFFHKWLADMRESQNHAGVIPHVVPNIMGDDAGASAAWADACVVIPWEIYIRTGDRRLLEDNFNMMLRWVDFMEADSPGLIRKEYGFGDWLQPYRAAETGRHGDTSRSLIGTAYFVYSAETTARIARILGESGTAERLEKLAVDVRQIFCKTFWTGENRLTSDTQTAYLLALAFDLLPQDARPYALANLLRLIEEADRHLRTGFVGTPLLAPVLTRFGHTDLAYEILLKETYPGWIFSIHQGATTLWERWESYSHAEGFGDAEMNSFNHYAYGAIGQWLYEHVAGLAPDPEAPGYRHFFIQPKPGGGLQSAHAQLETPYGRAVSTWRIEGDTFVLETIVPEGAEATVYFPQSSGSSVFYRRKPMDKAESMRIGPGQHTFLLAK